MTHSADRLPPVIVLGGDANALSIARSLGADGVRVYAIGDPAAHTRYSRYCEWLAVPAGDNYEDAWTAYLLGPDSEPLRGAVLLAASDAAIEIIGTFREQLAEKFRLDDSNTSAQLCMLNKLCTYQKARDAGVPTPRFWVVSARNECLLQEQELPYPIIVKPVFSHVFDDRFGRKFFLARNPDELRASLQTMHEAGIEALLMEMIPGPDDRLCSYYTYLDESSDPLFHFTKRIIRRFPANMGAACYHVTDWIPEVRDLALKLFKYVGLRGLANAEFKRDERDGLLKLIECNARFTAANCLVAKSGIDLGRFVYNRIVGRPQPAVEPYAIGMRLWYPVEDFQSFLELRRSGAIRFGDWIASIAHRQMFPYFRWDDPVPTLVSGCRRLKNRVLDGWQSILPAGAALAAGQTHKLQKIS